MSVGYTYVYKACQIVLSEAGQQWTYRVTFEDEHYEPFPLRAFNNEEEALKAASGFCDNRIDNVTPIVDQGKERAAAYARAYLRYTINADLPTLKWKKSRSQ